MLFSHPGIVNCREGISLFFCDHEHCSYSLFCDSKYTNLFPWHKGDSEHCAAFPIGMREVSRISIALKVYDPPSATDTH